MEQLQYIYGCYFKDSRLGREIHFMILEVASEQQTKLARQRIIAEHNGVEWPPFSVMCASQNFVLRRAAE